MDMDIVQRVAKLETDISNIHTELKDVKEQNTAIYEIAASLKVMTHDFELMQEKVSDISDGQKDLSNKLDHEIERVKSDQDSFRERLNAVEGKGARFAVKFLTDIGGKALWLVLGTVQAFLMYQALPILKQ